MSPLVYTEELTLSVGRTLSTVRNAAINLIRHQGYPYVPDGWRDIASRPGFGLFLLWITKLIL